MDKEKEETKDLVIVKEKDQMLIEEDDLVGIARVAEQRVAAVKKIISMALKVTSESDWVDQQNKPYLQGNGAEAVANLFGVSWKFIEKPKKIDEEDGNYRYECALEMSFKGRTVEVIGARSTKDTFFTTRYKFNPETKQREPYQLPPSEVDSADVMKSSITNAIGNGVTRILGIRNATWEMLKEAGLNIEKIQKVRYSQQEESKESKNLRDEIKLMVLEMTGNDENKAKLLLEEVTSFVPKGKTEADRVKGKSHIKDLTEKQIQPTYGRIKERYDAWSKMKSNKNGSLTDFETALKFASSEEELDTLIQQAEQAGIKGEGIVQLRKTRDRRAVELRGALL